MNKNGRIYNADMYERFIKEFELNIKRKKLLAERKAKFKKLIDPEE